MSASSSWKQVAALNRVTRMGLDEKLRLEEILEEDKPRRYWGRNTSNEASAYTKALRFYLGTAQCDQSL